MGRLSQLGVQLAICPIVVVIQSVSEPLSGSDASQMPSRNRTSNNVRKPLHASRPRIRRQRQGARGDHQLATAPIRLVVMFVLAAWCGRGVCLRTFDIAAPNGGSLTRITRAKLRRDDFWLPKKRLGRPFTPPVRQGQTDLEIPRTSFRSSPKGWVCEQENYRRQMNECAAVTSQSGAVPVAISHTTH